MNILIAPLNWGMGHTTRMIPVGRRLINEGHNLYIGGSVGQTTLFCSEVAGAKPLLFEGFSVRYSKTLPQYIAVLVQLPFIIIHILAEHYRISLLVKKYKIDIVISDSRPGLWTNKATTVFVSHQHRIMMPPLLKSLEPFVARVTRGISERYNFCWIPDYQADINISGDLSHNIKLSENSRFIGPLSRFNDTDSGFIPGFNYDEEFILVILSGPEPQRSYLLELLLKALKSRNELLVILDGRYVSGFSLTRDGRTLTISGASGAETEKLIRCANEVISRSGYTTIMELVQIGKGAILIPTPGQTEQEYLATHLEGRYSFRFISQEIIIRDGLPDRDVTGNMDGRANYSDNDLLERALQEVTKHTHNKSH